MALDFPSSPANGAEYASGGMTYVYNGTGWTVKAASTVSDPLKVNKAGDTMTGPLMIHDPACPWIGFGSSAVGILGGIWTYDGVTTDDTKLRWGMTFNEVDFRIDRHTDVGAIADTSLYINRATGVTTLTGDLTIAKASPALLLNRPAGGSNVRIISSVNGVDRWTTLYGSADAETGSSAGSNFVLFRHDDVGNATSTLVINRATGDTTLAGNLTITKAHPVIALDKLTTGQSTYVSGHAAGVLRWQLRLGNDEAETGSNSGSNFDILRFSDAGAFLGGSLNINRATAAVALSSTTNSTSPTTGALTVAGGLGVGGNINMNAAASIGVGVDSTQVPGIGNTVTGVAMGGAGYMLLSRAAGQGPVIFANLNGDGALQQFQRSGVVVGSISVTTSATAYNTSSDAELKEDLKSFDAGNIIDNTNVYDFAWKSTGERSYGVLAQQAVEVYPTAVTHQEKVTEKGAERDEWWGIDYSKYVPVLLQELKALRARMAEVEGRLEPDITPAKGGKR